MGKSGLNKMNREHIHLTASDRVDKSIGVISGFRNSCQVLIYIDIVNAVKDGYRFFVSANNVVLCEGDRDGTLPVKYFLKVIDRDSGKDNLKDHDDKETKKVLERNSTSTSSSNNNGTKAMENRAKNLKKKISKIKKMSVLEAKLNGEQAKMVKSLPVFEK